MSGSEVPNPKKTKGLRRFILRSLVGLFFLVLFLGLFVHLPHWSSRKQENEAAALETMRELYAAVTRYRAHYPQWGSPPA